MVAFAVQRARSVVDLVFLGMSLVLVVLTIVALLRAYRPCHIMPWLRSVREDVRTALRQRSSATDDEVGRIVKEKMKEMKLRNMKRAARLSALCMSIITGMMTLRIFSGRANRGFEPEDVFHLAAHATAVLAAIWAEALTWRTVDIWYSIGVLIQVVYTLPWMLDAHTLLPRIMMSNLAVLYLNSERRDWRIVVPWNVAYAISSTASILMLWQVPSPNLQAEPLGVVQLLTLALFPACTHWVEMGTATTLRQSLEAEAASELLQAASALLRSCNDVVVELDSDGAVVGPVQDLASFLLRSPSSLSAKVRLSDLVAEDDRQLFLSRLKAKRTDGCSLAEAIRVHMRDGNGALLKVEVSSFGYRRVDGQMRHMTGIRDSSDLPPSGRRDLESQVASLQPSSQPASSSQPSLVASWQSEGSQSSSEDEPPPTAVRIGSPLSDMNDAIGGKAVLIIDSTIEGLPIIGASGQFQISIGRARPGARFLDMVRPAEEVADWLEMGACVGAAWPPIRVALLMRQGEFRASCRILHEAWEGGPPDGKHLHLVFDKIKRPKLLADTCEGRGGPARPHANFKGTPASHGNPANHASL